MIRSRRRFVLAATAGVLVLAAALVAAWVAMFSDVWSARAVHVVGGHRLSAAQIEQAADIDRHRPLLRLSTAGVAARVDALPDIASARVTTTLPDTVTIRVVERVPAAYEQVSGGYTYVDATGHTFGRTTDKPAHLAELVPGPQVATDVGVLAALATVAHAVPTALRAQIDLISADAVDDIRLVLRDKRVVIWGDDTANADKAAVLPALLHRPATQYDVSNPGLVVTR